MLKFTVLTENQETDRLECEHGLSFYIEYNEKKYLLDAGKSAVFMRNAEKLGVNLKEVEAAVLSHAHYDHADGLAAFLQENTNAKVYARVEGKQLDCYSVGSEKVRYIGMNPEIPEVYGERFCWVGESDQEQIITGTKEPELCMEEAGQKQIDPLQIAEGMWLLGHSTPGLESIGRKTGMYRFRGTLIPDSFAHEQSLIFETEKGLVVFNSCSHGGVANIVTEVRTAFPGKQILAYIGGFHLKAPGTDALNGTEEEVEELGRALVKLGIRKIFTGHCTGSIGYEILKRVMGERLHKLYPGFEEKL